MIASKTDVWHEFNQLLSSCPEHLVVVASLLLYVLDDEDLDNRLLIRAIRQTRADLHSDERSDEIRNWWA
jgi:hypothetical protein